MSGQGVGVVKERDALIVMLDELDRLLLEGFPIGGNARAERAITIVGDIRRLLHLTGK